MLNYGKKTALVTGASRGIGAQTASVLHREGFGVFINYLSSESKAQELSKKLGTPALCADLSCENEVERMFKSLPGIDLLVNNLGISHHGLINDMDTDSWRRLFATNLDSAYYCIKHVLPHMLSQKYGNIINVSSVWGIYGSSCEAAYSASKSALIGLSRSLAKELGPSGIRVNCVAPGVIDTDMLLSLSPGDKAALVDETPLRRLGSPADVAELIAFLASDRADFITGELIGVSGGFGL